MEITINIDNEKFEKLVSIQNKITDEEMAELFKEGLKSYFESDEFKQKMNGVFFQKVGYYDSNLTITPRGMNILENIFSETETKKEYEEIVKSIIEKNSKEIVIKSLATIILDGIMHRDLVTNCMKDTALDTIYQVINDNKDRWGLRDY